MCLNIQLRIYNAHFLRKHKKGKAIPLPKRREQKPPWWHWKIVPKNNINFSVFLLLIKNICTQFSKKYHQFSKILVISLYNVIRKLTSFWCFYLRPPPWQSINNMIRRWYPKSKQWGLFQLVLLTNGMSLSVALFWRYF